MYFHYIKFREKGQFTEGMGMEIFIKKNSQKQNLLGGFLLGDIHSVAKGNSQGEKDFPNVTKYILQKVAQVEKYIKYIIIYKIL